MLFRHYFLCSIISVSVDSAIGIYNTNFSALFITIKPSSEFLQVFQSSQLQPVCQTQYSLKYTPSLCIPLVFVAQCNARNQLQVTVLKASHFYLHPELNLFGILAKFHKHIKLASLDFKFRFCTEHFWVIMYQRNKIIILLSTLCVAPDSVQYLVSQSVQFSLGCFVITPSGLKGPRTTSLLKLKEYVFFSPSFITFQSYYKGQPNKMSNNITQVESIKAPRVRDTKQHMEIGI